MTIGWTTGSQTAILTLLKADLESNLAGYLTTIGTARGLTLPSPVADSVYVGGLEMFPGVWPSVGLSIEGAEYIPMQSAEYDRVLTLSATVIFAEGQVDATGPAGMYLSALAYSEAVAQCIEERAVAVLGAIGVWRADKLTVHAEQSPAPAVMDFGGRQVWVIAGVALRMRIYQAIERAP
jgi:hypothetical protein